jgi:hypothetical protein
VRLAGVALTASRSVATLAPCRAASRSCGAPGRRLARAPRRARRRGPNAA